MNLLSEFEWYPLHEKSLEKMRKKLKDNSNLKEKVTNITLNTKEPEKVAGKVAGSQLQITDPDIWEDYYQEAQKPKSKLRPDEVADIMRVSELRTKPIKTSATQKLKNATKNVNSSAENIEDIIQKHTNLNTSQKKGLLNKLRSNKKLLLGLGLGMGALGTLGGAKLVEGHKRKTKDGKTIFVKPFRREYSNNNLSNFFLVGAYKGYKKGKKGEDFEKTVKEEGKKGAKFWGAIGGGTGLLSSGAAAASMGAVPPALLGAMLLGGLYGTGAGALSGGMGGLSSSALGHSVGKRQYTKRDHEYWNNK